MHKDYHFSSASEQVLAIAVQESLYFKHYFIGTEHIFNGLCKCEDEAVLQALAQDRIDPTIRRAIRQTLIPGPGTRTTSHMMFTPRVHRLFKASQEIARENNAGQIEPIHLLLGLLRSGDGLAVRLLRRLHHSPEAIEKAAEGLLVTPTTPAKGKTLFLNALGRDLTAMAREGQLDPVIGRTAEISLMAQTLLRKKKNNLLLVGDAGVGKTSLVEGLAQLIANGEAPPALADKRIVEISMGALVSGTKYRGDLEQRVQRLLVEAKERDIILFIDEFHTVVGSGVGSEAGADVGNMLKPALASGQVRLIGATTWKEYRTRIEPDAALERRFQIIDVKELTPEESITLLERLREIYEGHHGVRIAPEAVRAAVDLSVRFLTERRLPDKAIDLIDQACANLRLQLLAGDSHDAGTSADFMVGREEVALTLASWLGIPLDRLLQHAEARYLNLEESLQKRILGQSNAIKELASALRLAHLGLIPSERPRGIFFFIGPTGVGKTEMAQTLAEALVPGERALVRLDMSEFMEAHAVAKLIGAPPGYIGYGDEGQLTGPVRRHPGSVVLFDEIDKAHPEILNLLLQVLDAGQLTDSKGRPVNFREAIIIFTSNLHSSGDGAQIGFGGQVASSPRPPGLEAELRARFRPEFLNRLDKIIFFHGLGPEVCRQLVKNSVEEIISRLLSQGITLDIDESLYEVLLEKADFHTYGAREIKRTVSRFLAEPLSHWLLSRSPGAIGIKVHYEKGKIDFTVQEVPQAEIQ